MSRSSVRRIAAEERVFSLILALVASPQGLTKHALLSSVYGYVDDYQSHGQTSAIDRKFERDKEQLRTLGVPLETLDSPLEPGNNQLTRYRISKDLLELPAEVRFTPEELVLLRAAALAWSESSLSDDARRAVMKLNALGATLDTRQLGVAPQISITEPSAHALRRAIDAGRVVKFQYRKPGEDHSAQRRVEPLRLHRADKRWHLLGFDCDRGDYRVFLLSRITGEVVETSDPVDQEHLGIIPDLIEELEARQEINVGTLRVKQGSVAHARLQPRASDFRVEPDGFVLVTVGTLDFAAFAEELIGYGADVSVLSPPELVDEVTALLDVIVSQHRHSHGNSHRTDTPHRSGTSYQSEGETHHGR